MLLSDLNLTLARSAARGLLPMALGTRAARAKLSRSVRRRAVFSARVTNADFLHAIFEAVNRMLQGGYESDQASRRLALKQLLAQLQYDPKTGFPGDRELGIPPAEPGSIRDLSSDRRLNLILETQTDLMRGAVQKAQAMEPTAMKMFPWFELRRMQSRRTPRGSPDSGTSGWPERWTQAAGPAPVTYQGKTLLIAPKDHIVWHNLGDSDLFDDALDVDHPPFAFGSGMGWRQVHYTEGRAMDLQLPDFVLRKTTPAPGSQPITLPPPQASVSKWTPAEKQVFKQALEDLGPVMELNDILKLS
jgi:hypothetical protein